MTAERDWKSLLDGVDLSGIEQMQEGGWELRENLLDVEPDKRKYLISKGLVNLELITRPDITALSWDAKLPKYLTPGNNVQNFMEFLYWVQSRLPMRLYPEKERQAWHYRKGYMKHSNVTIIFTDEKEKSYSFANEREDKALAIDFVTRGEEINAYMITGSESPLSRDFGYNLGVDLHGNGEAQMALAVPTSSDGLGAWNSRTLEWILKNHLQKSRLDKDLLPDGVELEELISGKVKEELFLKFSSETQEPLS